MSAGIEFVLPDGFRLPDGLPTGLADPSYWLVSTIVRKVAGRDDLDMAGCVQLDSRIMRRIMGRDYAKAVGLLDQAGAIETVPHLAGVHARGFRLAKRYLTNRATCRRASDPWFIERYHRERQRQQEFDRRDWGPHHAALADQQKGLTISKEADVILGQLQSATRLGQSVLVENIRYRRLSYTVSRSTGRTFNLLTGMKSELRAAVRLNRQPIGAVDLCCAQPALLAAMLEGKITLPNPPCWASKGVQHRSISPPVPPSSLGSIEPHSGSTGCLFASLAAAGTLYDVLAHEWGIDREYLKKRILVDVLAKGRNYNSEVERLFQRQFPDVYAAIRQINKDDHATLIRLLQRCESWTVCDNVAPRLVARGIPVVTVHDAIFAHHQRLADVEDEFRQFFAESGFSVAMKRET